ncbi:hypothetical protein WJ968_37360 [Achromobacter xylosoxidans]
MSKWALRGLIRIQGSASSASGSGLAGTSQAARHHQLEHHVFQGHFGDAGQAVSTDRDGRVDFRDAQRVVEPADPPDLQVDPQTGVVAREPLHQRADAHHATGRT